MRFLILSLAFLFTVGCVDYVVFWATAVSPPYDEQPHTFRLGDRVFRNPHPEWDEMTVAETMWQRVGMFLTKFHDSPRVTSSLVRSVRSYAFLRSRQFYPGR